PPVTPKSGRGKRCSPATKLDLATELLELLTRQLDLAEHGLARRCELRLRQGHEALATEIAVLAECLVGDILGHELVDARNNADVRLLEVDEHLSRALVLAGGNGIEIRSHAFDGNAAQLGGVLFQEGVAEDAERLRVGL